MIGYTRKLWEEIQDASVFCCGQWAVPLNKNRHHWGESSCHGKVKILVSCFEVPVGCEDSEGSQTI